MTRFRHTSLAALALALAVSPVQAQDNGAAAAAAPAPGLLFHASLDESFDADAAQGQARPEFRSGMSIVPDGAIGSAARWADEGYVAWNARGNMQAARGTLGFFWRAREPVGEAPFNIFRASFSDHSSWDMAFLRIDWNGHGFDAFVTDANLSRMRVSWQMPERPAPDRWLHIAFAWDETIGVRLFVDGQEVARRDGHADLDSGLDGFGLAGRVLSPHQVQSRYNFMRGSDVDELRVYDSILDPAAIAALAARQDPATVPAVLPGARARQAAWLHRYGWDRETPPVLADAVTRVRKVEFADARDLKQWMWKGVDGIAETTWPGVYNRSRLPGRNDYFQLPDWNTYAEGGKSYMLTVPETERVNRIELRGAAYGTLDWTGPAGRAEALAQRPEGVVRSVTDFAPRTGGTIRLTNRMQEQPVQELWAYDMGAGTEPAGSFALSYTVDPAASVDLAALAPLRSFIAGRFPAEERSTVVALPTSGIRVAVGAGSATDGAALRMRGDAPVAHIVIPSSFGDAEPDRPIARAWDYGWENLHDGLDGVAIDLPALDLPADADGRIPLNIRVRDPLWPERDMIDLSVSVRPREARTLWLDLRDRILPAKSMLISIASANAGFTADSLKGANIRLVFKPRAEAVAEHVADRFNQVKDNWAFLVEEHTASKRANLYKRLYADITDLLAVDPEHEQGRAYWSDINYRPENIPAVTLPEPPAGVPLWAFRQVEDLKQVRRFIEWWIDERQVPYGDFGGGLSDDTDLVQQWPGVALMGILPDKINASLRAVSDAVYRDGMITDGLGTIATDELHAYEEGLNSNAARLYLNWGEPLAVERIMDNVRGLSRVILPNPAGHLHFASSWYGATAMYRDPHWEWQKPYAFTVMHGPILLGMFNGDPTARGLVTGLVDGLLAHGKQAADGSWTYPNEINWRTDEERAGDGGGATVPLQSAWAAWRFTGDARYLAPVTSRLARSAGGAAEFNENLFDLLPEGAALRGRVARGAAGGDPFARYAAWAETGDTGQLSALHEDAIAQGSQRMYMMTEGHWWSDRVELPSAILQRERLGGIALARNQTVPGNTVSWRFAQDGAAEQVAILVPGATRDRFRVIAWNMSGVPQAALMDSWNVTAGQWTVQAGTSADEGRTVTATGPAETVTLERGAQVPVSFAPGTTTVLDFQLVQAGTPVEGRADLGIGPADLRRRGSRLEVTVHSLGAQATSGGEARLVDAGGTVVARTSIPALEAPIDLTPRTATVRLQIPRGSEGLRVEVALPQDGPEVTRRNNSVAVPQG
jgi:hypothetical protein